MTENKTTGLKGAEQYADMLFEGSLIGTHTYFEEQRVKSIIRQILTDSRKYWLEKAAEELEVWAHVIEGLNITRGQLDKLKHVILALNDKEK